MGVGNLEAHRLHKLCSDLLGSGFVAGSSKLYEIERAAYACLDQCSGVDRTICFSMAVVLDHLAKSQQDRPVLPEEGVALANALNQPLNQCADYLVGRGSGLDPMQLVARLMDAYVRVARLGADAN
jgi:hypothetical protein